MVEKGFLCSSVADTGSECLFDPWIRDSGSGMGKKTGSGSGIRIRDDQHGSYFRELRNQFFGLKYLNYLMWIRDPGRKNSDRGSGMENMDLG
jgi:hypothetical protein